MKYNEHEESKLEVLSNREKKKYKNFNLVKTIPYVL